jgi:hypothetical protein
MHAAPIGPSAATPHPDEFRAIWRMGGILLAAFTVWASLFNPSRTQFNKPAASFGGDAAGSSKSGPVFVAPPPDLSAHFGPASNSSDDVYWEDGFVYPYRGVSGAVHTLFEASDGAVYVGGAFEFAGGIRAGNVARYDPVTNEWSALRGGVNGLVSSIVEGADGRIYVGGAFSEADGVSAVGLVAWDSILGDWQPVSGAPNQAVEALLSLPDGRLAVGGAFSQVDGIPSAGVAYYDPLAARWASAYGGVGGRVSELYESPDGSLIAGGVLAEFGHVARLQAGSTAWESMGTGAPGPVQTFLEAPIGDGVILAAGRFSSGPTPEEFLVRWDETSGTWISTASGLNGSIEDLMLSDSGRIMAVGAFTKAGGEEARGLAIHDGQGWRPVANLNSRVQVLLQLSGGRVLAGGAFTSMDGKHADGLVMLDGAWRPLEAPAAGNGLDGPVFDVVARADGVVFASGVFTRAAGAPVSSVGEWNQAAKSWQPLGAGLNNLVKTLAVDGEGGLYAGGYFTASGEQELLYAAHWDGSSWSPLGDGLNGAVEDITVGPDGVVYVVGYFSQAGGQPAASVARWYPETQSWESLGTGMNSGVDAVAVADDGTVYVGGSFTLADGHAAPGIARWDESEGRWMTLGLGKNSIVRALTIAKDGDLYAGGVFTRAGTVAADYVARWRPSQEMWHPLGLGLNSAVRSLHTAPDGSVLVGGVFTRAGGEDAKHIARWTPSESRWSGLGSGMNASVRGMAHDPDGTLYLGGFFTQAGGKDAAHFSVWGGDAVSTAGEPLSEVPVGVELHQNYPNPFNPVTTIAFDLADAGQVRLSVFDLLGREMQVLVEGRREAGRHQAVFDASSLATGTFIYRLDTENGSIAKTLTVIR